MFSFQQSGIIVTVSRQMIRLMTVFLAFFFCQTHVLTKSSQALSCEAAVNLNYNSVSLACASVKPHQFCETHGKSVRVDTSDSVCVCKEGEFAPSFTEWTSRVN